MSNLVSVPKNGNLVKHSSKSSLPTISDWMSDFFNGEFPSLMNQNFNTGISLPKVNIKETADNYEVEMAAPGLSKKDFHIDLDNSILSISTEKTDDSLNEDENFTRREFGYSSFKRTFKLPETVDEEKIQAKYEDGILKVHLPKREEAKKKPARNIKIS